MRWIALILVGALALSGCATTRTKKPILTKRAFQRIARSCGVTPTEFKTARSGLPYIRFLYRDAAQASNVRAAPSVECVGTALKAYRYEYFGPDADPPSSDD
ncbi:hypothetical protein [Sphingomonas sp. SORGH_AS_0879]|uniref:hypothetical protein n=1 Tax=Sphingomonas sp. SORGH_AS_0879 TaxID=3041790 RepID=UPI0027807901|nr:hypothetical protein [Sphingomonas sp. SORGH_AS_0879]MDQ1228702.1 hypothetical protein [Sphingomonas sp. SORGH_AS_0879]